MQPTHSLQPQKSSFLFQRVSAAAIFCFLAAAGTTFGLWKNDVGFLMVPWLVAFFFFTIPVFSAFVAFRKEAYEVFDRHIVARSGGIFSDQVTELEFGNVTHVKQRLPWVRYRLFDVGDVVVQSAGSSLSQVVFRSVRGPDRVYQMLQDQLRENGYSMQRMELLHEEQPDKVGAAVEVIGLGIGILLGIILPFALVILEGIAILLGTILPFALVILDGADDGPVDVVSALLDGSFKVFALISIVVSIGTMALRYLDLRNRTYQVFDDVVVYTEGFLSRTNAVIPYENIADANTVQTLFDQVLGLYDVKISCQGSSAEIRFRRLRRGEDLKAQIGRLVASAEAAKREKVAAKAIEKAAARAGSDTPPVRSALPPVPAGEAWTATFQPNAMREVVGLLPIFPIFPLFLGLAIMTWIAAAARQYTVGTSSARIKKGIFNITETDFAYDKITGAMVRRGPLDRILSTVTVELWSIGSPQPLVLSCVNTQDIEIDALLRQVGIARTPPAREVPSRFTLGVWLRISLPLFFVLGVTIAVITVGSVLGEVPEVMLLALALALSPLPYFVYRQAWAAKQSLTLHADHAELQSGLFWRKHYFASYDMMKKLSITRYPWSDQGDLKIFVAGERQVQNNQQGGAVMPYSFDVKFLESIPGLASLLDDIIRGVRDAGDTRSAVDVAPIREAKPKLLHAISPLIILSPILFVFLPIALPWAIVAVKNRSYVLESNRVVVRSGILFKKEVSVLYDRIDSLQRKQGALGKVFGTGQVTLFTAGSSQPDLRLTCVPEFGAMYQDIRERYSGADD